MTSRLDILEMFAEAQSLCPCAPAQDGLEVYSDWIYQDKRRQQDRERKRVERGVDAIVDELHILTGVKACACGCGEPVERGWKYASEACRKAASVKRRQARREEALRQIREAEGIEERVCALDGCEVVFPVEHGRGRPRLYCCLEHQVLAKVRAWRARRSR